MKSEEPLTHDGEGPVASFQAKPFDVGADRLRDP
jgi:hypothetical protein